MGLLDGKTALIFGVANDHSIAWGIAQALHAEGAEVGFSSVESLIEKRVRPLAESIGSTFVEPCDVGSDEQIAAVFARWGETHESLDILVHALAFARREDLEGGFVDTSRDGFALALDVSAYSLVALAREARPLLPARIVGHDPDLLRVREGRRQLQRHGRGQGRPRGVRALPRGRPRPGRACGSTPSRPGPSGRWPRPGSPGSRACTAAFADIAPLRANITPEDVGRSARLPGVRPVERGDRRGPLRGRRVQRASGVPSGDWRAGAPRPIRRRPPTSRTSPGSPLIGPTIRDVTQPP